MSSSRGELVPLAHRGELQPYSRPRDHIGLRESVRGPARLGACVIGIFVFGFGGWATIVPIAGGAVAPGIISPDGSRRTVQHLEGGIIRTLHVRDGDVVERGDPLLELESVQPKANHDLLQKQQRTLRVTKARLEAERSGKDEVEFPADLMEAGPEVAAMMAGQQELFLVRRRAHESKNRILRQRAGQLREQIKGFEAQVASAARQIEFLEEEISGKRELASKGYLPKPELLRMLRMQAELGGRLGQYEAAISEAQQQIGEAELQMVANDAARADQIATQLDQVQAELNGIDEKLLASRDILRRTVIAAPVGGTVVNLKFKTVSGVIQPGVPILDIVPAEEKLIIEARISPIDIDVVHAGLKAQVQLSAFSRRSAPRIHGVVRSISADRMVEDGGKAFYLARVEVDRDEVERIGPNIELVPGMPADVLIVTGERTLADYLLRPFLDAVWKTMRET
jgi:HlyD family secretion protein/epimerase transport system membrane fusion protein